MISLEAKKKFREETAGSEAAACVGSAKNEKVEKRKRDLRKEGSARPVGGTERERTIPSVWGKKGGVGGGGV